MVAYYNEHDAFAAQWLRNLIAAGHVAPGDVDERSIVDVRPSDLAGYTQCHFFAGIGVWSHALRGAGVADSRSVWTGSCPCQPFSQAGAGAGFDDERHLWPHLHWLISQCRPAIIFGEQVASKDGLGWLDLVQADLEGTDYAFGAAGMCAAGFGAPHIRQRLYWVADNHGIIGGQGSAILGGCDHRDDAQTWAGLGGGRIASELADASSAGLERRDERTVERPAGPTNGFWRDADWLLCRDGKWRPVGPGTFPLAHGASGRVGRLRAYGNAIVSEQARTFIEACLDS